MNATPILGTWNLLGWYNDSECGQRHYPFTETATGYISYTSDGFVFVHLAAPERQAYMINDPFGGSLEEDSAAMKSQITYAGTYEFFGDRVAHNVQHASCPNWVGMTLERQAAFIDKRLLLTAPGTFLNGEEVTACLEWERAALRTATSSGDLNRSTQHMH